MKYKVGLTQGEGYCVYVIMFGDTPDQFDDPADYSDDNLSAEGPNGIRHYVVTRNGKIVQIQLHEAPQVIPDLDPERPESIPMPGFHAIMRGNPPVPTLLLTFKDELPENNTAYALSPNVFLAFDDGQLAQLYITDVYNVIDDVDS